MTKEKLLHIGVKALITNKQGDILVLKTIPLQGAAVHWDIPGGRIKEGHSVEETLRREVLEETGLQNIAQVEFFTAVVSNIEIPVPDLGKVGLLLMVYTVQIPDSTTIVLSEEHTAYEWVDHTEAAERLRYKYPDTFTALLAKRLV